MVVGAFMAGLVWAGSATEPSTPASAPAPAIVAPTANAEQHDAPSAPARPPSGTEAQTAMAVALDPKPGDPLCAGYALDGLSLGMTLSQARRIVTFYDVPPEASLIPSFKDSTLGFRARREGRIDTVQVGFTSLEIDGRLAYIRANILVGKQDGWPASLFKALGSPKRARLEEWVFWEESCAATLRLTLLQSLGGRGIGQPYLLELRNTAKKGSHPQESRQSAGESDASDLFDPPAVDLIPEPTKP